MIVYDPLWHTMKVKRITTYMLSAKYGISRCTIDQLKHNKSVRTTTLDKLCTILSCSLSDIALHLPNEFDCIQENP